MESYLAHSAKNGYPSQPYLNHVYNTTKWSLIFAREMKGYCRKDAEQIENILCLAASYHDLGKLDEKNQEVLHKEGVKAGHLPVNHMDAGAAFLKQKGQEARCSLILVYAHHQGLPDFTVEENRAETVCYRDARESVRACFDREMEQLLQIHRQLIPESTAHNPEYCEGDMSMFFRMVFSCLVDADHSDTATVYGQYPEQDNIPKLQPSLRLEALNRYVASLGEKNQNKRNDLRTQMYKRCRDGQREEGIVSNAGSVGSGKTTAVMAYQLNQAILKGARRIFVVLPYTNIITQSVEVYRQALALPGEEREAVVAELHCKADFEDEDTRYLTSLWRAPIIVTTAAAFFETLASNRPGALRRLHELPGSVIFMDEAHAALPLKLLPLAWHWMKVLEDEWSCSWILASGSLVRFWQIPELVGIEKKQVPEMVPTNLRSELIGYEKNRIQFCWNPCPFSRAELIDWVMAKPGPRLVIMNTVQSAAVVADDICRKYGRECVEHLSTALMPKDRADTIEAVKKRLENQEDTNWVLVATSCVEAGVDFSFQIGFRELASVLSLLQAAGRVNRNGCYKDAQMWSFSMQDDTMLTQNPGVKISAGILEEYLQDGMEITPELSTKSIRDELQRGKTETKEMQALMEAEAIQNFKTVNDRFHVIENDAVPVIVKADVAEQIELGYGNWKEVQKYSVSIRRKNLEKWQVKQIAEDVYQWTLFYDSFLGYMAGVLRQAEFDYG
ncbi:CRISPR-associated endonuclease Cas3'' [Lachnoclostridium pacaense]|uniref:CRISPR-associated endonuclease Cas3'' n=1 Tax=Enterocloster hominis (ex Hitch et al. 2024) TaxID=1917870 RepID=UPI001D107C46|nr:CRISPR-associated endonuclease Cas3'' [Lachnoclostridium pacaense]MCC2815941.1 CRISPR-associated endonuclease Cas3'' [Lachnoclostridium pacaense]